MLKSVAALPILELSSSSRLRDAEMIEPRYVNLYTLFRGSPFKVMDAGVYVP